VIIQADYVAEAKDEPSIYRTYLGERKREFTFDFITAEEVQEVADELLEQNKNIKVYYDCTVRGNPYVELLDEVKLTAPKCSVSNLECRVIRIDHTVEAGHWTTILGLEAELVQTVEIPYERLDIDNVSGTFIVGETITGGDSGATAVIRTVAATYLYITERDSATDFEDDEEITGGTSSATADVNNSEGSVGLIEGSILHLDMDPPHHLDAGYYIEQTS